jgi:hypothetical protein
MSEEQRTRVIKLTYKNIKHALMSSLTPSWVVLRDSLDKEHFDEALEAFSELLTASSNWLKVAKDHTQVNGDIIDPDTVSKIIKHPVQINLSGLTKEESQGCADDSKKKDVNKGGY